MTPDPVRPGKEERLEAAIREYKASYDKHYRLPNALKAASQIYPEAERKLFAALAADTEEERCPTCGSDHPSLVRGSPEPGSIVPPFCPDTFHNRFPNPLTSSEGKRWTINVCPDCGEYSDGTGNGYPLYSNCEGQRHRLAETVEVLPAAEVERLREALGEARPYVYNRTQETAWRGETAREVLARVDAALAADTEEKPNG